jgi:hypothetical protein
MGFASCLENINERYSLSNYRSYLGATPQQRDVEEAKFLFGDPLDRPRRLIRDFWTYYRQHPPLDDFPRGRWEEHVCNIKVLHDILAPISQLHEQNPDAWLQVKKTEAGLRTFFQETQVYGPLSRSVFQQVFNNSKAIVARCTAVVRELNQFHKTVRSMPVEERAKAEIEEAVRQLDEIKERLSRDLKELEQYAALATEAQQVWDCFLKLFTVLAVQSRYRPALQNLDRFHLNEEQERYVALDHKGGYRIQGASGSGKTIILIHRALRLIRENPAAQVRLFTINRALAHLLQSSLVAIHGQIPPNLHVAAFYDFLLDCVCLFEPRDKYRLVDKRSRERIVVAWHDFYHHGGQEAQQNVFAVEDVRELIRSVGARENGKLDASRYLREEMVYIQSAYRKQDRQQYLTDHRQSRSIAFQRSQKEVCLRVLQAWEEWLDVGNLCDIDGLALRAAEHFEEPAHLARICEVLPTDFVLIDEVQDFSTLELGLVRTLIPDLDGDNRIFLVGDLNQKVYPKHHDSRRAGFDFRGKAGILKQNFRNTRQILHAAYNLPQAFPPKEDEEEGVDIMSPDLSIYEGGRPVVFECTPGNHLPRVLEIVKLRRRGRTAIVSENDRLLAEIRREAGRLGFQCHELLRNEDIDLWREQGNSLTADLVVSRLEAVKGFEFDTVIACDLSQGVIPRAGTPEEEHWRQAAILYTALTRARDELILTFVGEPSRFLKAMLADMDLHEGIDETTLRQVLAIA